MTGAVFFQTFSFKIRIRAALQQKTNYLLMLPSDREQQREESLAARLVHRGAGIEHRAGDFRVAEKRRLHQHSAIAPFAFTGRRIHQRKNRREISAPHCAAHLLFNRLI